MKKNFIYLVIGLITSLTVKAQDVNYLLTEAAQLEKEMKDGEALKKYQEALQLAPTDLKALTKCSELNSMMETDWTIRSQNRNILMLLKHLQKQLLK
jgi:hypothetical protein